MALTPKAGPADFARPDNSPLPAGSKVAEYGRYPMFTADVAMVAMTYMYAGEQEFGLDLARRHCATLVLGQRHTWDLPNVVLDDTGKRFCGT